MPLAPPRRVHARAPRRRGRHPRVAPAKATGAAALEACTRAAWRAARTRPDAAQPARQGPAAARQSAPGATRRGRRRLERRWPHAAPAPQPRQRTRPLAPRQTMVYARTAPRRQPQQRQRHSTRLQRRRLRGRRAQWGRERPNHWQRPRQPACVAGRDGEGMAAMHQLQRGLQSAHVAGTRALRWLLPLPPSASAGARGHRRRVRLKPARVRPARYAAAHRHRRVQQWLQPKARDCGVRAAWRLASSAPRQRS